MLGPLLILQLTAAAPQRDTIYSSRGLEAFIAAAAVANSTAPIALRGYRARVESELSLILRDTLGRERVAQVEQLAMRATWERNQRYELHVIGYRSETVGVPYSALSFARSWTIPHLYGDRLTLGVEFPQSGRSSASNRSKTDSSAKPVERAKELPDTLRSVHPLAADRERFYRYSGGDTVAVLHTRNRDVPLARVYVRPVFDSAARNSRIGAFEGEIDFDATRHQIVRMRGQFVATPGPAGKRPLLARLPGIVAVAYVEFVNAEVNGQYWLPAFQRSEFQATLAPLGSQRSVFRLVSRFADFDVDVANRTDSAYVDSSAILNSGALRERRGYRGQLTYAPADSVSRYREWIEPLGSATANVKASDFDDLAPDAWRVNGPPRVDFSPTKLNEIFRFNRVEGAYTGFAVGERFRDAAPGLTAHAFGGWAWSERTLRGGGSLIYRPGRWSTGLRVERSLANTNDFTPPLEDGTEGFGALFAGVDDKDYLDRRSAILSLTRNFAPVHDALVILETGFGADRPEITRLNRSMLGVGRFRLNRASADGNYGRGSITMELHPDVTGTFLEPGLGLISSYEIARGQLKWQRAEATLALRHNVSDFVVAGRAQGGVVIGSSLPPQTLFELGGENALPGYGYKQFAGDHAATAGVLLGYTFRVLRRPWRLVRTLVLPGVSPGIAVGIQGGWAEASTAAARAAIRNLDPLVSADCELLKGCPDPLSTPTNGIRATLDARLTLFGGLVGLGVARPVDRAAPWRFAFRFGQDY
jgi:hypothetical protein